MLNASATPVSALKMAIHPAMGNVYVLRVSVVSECPTDPESRRSARPVNFAAVESARTYSVIGATVGIAGLR